MGYDLHITRAEDWTEAESAPITLDEWRSFVANDPEMTLVGVAETQLTDGQMLRYQSEGLAVWVRSSGNQAGGNKAWFDHRHGEIVVKNPDDQIIQKMIEIAHRFNANVQGDDGERYPLPTRDKPSLWRKLFDR